MVLGYFYIYKVTKITKIMLHLLQGIGPCYASKSYRSGIRMGDLTSDDFDSNFIPKFRQLAADHIKAFGIEINIDEEIENYRKLAEEIRPYVCETVSYLHEVLSSGAKVLVEGANASMLDIGMKNWLLVDFVCHLENHYMYFRFWHLSLRYL